MPALHLEGIRTMILITVTINELENGSVDMRVVGQTIVNNTNLEADAADAIKNAITAKRDEFFSGEGGWTKKIIQQTYTRSFDSPEERDKRVSNHKHVFQETGGPCAVCGKGWGELKDLGLL